MQRHNRLEIAGGALRPFRDTRPLLQDYRSPEGLCNSCGSGLVSRKGRTAAPLACQFDIR
ncbi:hypothetical protein DMX06_16060 [Pseudomonas mosselii]|nr:hypothetical protein DMX06_16060 [Pseudomonas mosselii]